MAKKRLKKLHAKDALEFFNQVAKAKPHGPPAYIWSLGCTVLEMLTGKVPYPDMEWTYALLKIGRGIPPEIPNKLSEDACDFIMRLFVYGKVVISEDGDYGCRHTLKDHAAEHVWGSPLGSVIQNHLIPTMDFMFRGTEQVCNPRPVGWPKSLGGMAAEKPQMRRRDGQQAAGFSPYCFDESCSLKT